MPMKSYDVLRNKAVVLRQNGYSLPEICNRLKTSKSTTWYWIKDVEMLKPNAFLSRTKRKHAEAARKAALAHRNNAIRKHQHHADEAVRLWENGLRDDPDFRLFLMLYMAEGIGKGRDSFGMSNTNPHLIAFAQAMMNRININGRSFRYDLYLKQNLNESKAVVFWKDLLKAEEIHVHVRNDGHLKGRNWVSENGIMLIRVYDSYVKTMICVWIDLFTEEYLGTFSSEDGMRVHSVSKPCLS
jgi:hypothetical protein